MQDIHEKIRHIREWETGFPKRLRELKGMPKELYYIGTLPPEGPAVSIVGARSCTAYGREKAMGLGKYLAEHGVTVISGMADGIDGYAHEGAIQGGGKTYAVLGCGADICYPKRHAGLRDAIIGTGGGVLTEYPGGSEPAAWRFPARNRIISALADVVVVVEARRRSGSLITADFALEQGKTVLAFPGRMGDRLSEGTNTLIAQGAGIISTFDSVLWELAQCGRYILPEKITACGTSSDKRKKDGSGTERSGIEAPDSAADGIPEISRPENLRDILRDQIGYDPVSTQELLPSAGGDLAGLQSALLDLVLDGFVEELTPGVYVKRG
ncbi:MAG: DNA-protecting protein DprA [Lachnospiraceae bacterium]|nr:DNA-protecting protein DprA [Lachnospiraceae bacterium]